MLADLDLNESFFVVLASVWRGRGKGPLFVIFSFTLAYIYIYCRRFRKDIEIFVRKKMSF